MSDNLTTAWNSVRYDLKSFSVLVSLLLGAIVFGGCQAEDHQSSPATISNGDVDYPPKSVELKIESGQAGLNALMYLAEGAGPHPTVVFMHGYPGNERNLDVAQAVRRAGFNALYFNYRGSWGSGGTFSWQHALEDGLAAIEFASSGFAAESLRADTSKVYLFGHSFGGWVAVNAAANNQDVSGLAVMGTWNLGVSGRLMANGTYSDSDMAWVGEAFDDLSGPLRGDPIELLSQLENDSDRLDIMLTAVPQLTSPVLIISSTEDEGWPENKTEDFAAALESSGTPFIRHILPDDHSLSANRLWLEAKVVEWLAGLTPN